MRLLLPAAAVMVLLLCAGCAGMPEASYHIGDAGDLTLEIPSPSVTETVLSRETNVTTSRIAMHGDTGDVYALLSMPNNPVAGIVYAPGAGVTKEAHRERAERYARSGIAFLVLDIRGNGGETPGYPLDIAQDFALFTEGEWPQYYRIAGDLIAARKLLAERTGVPVYTMGSSNGGRYAILAAAADPDFAGAIGVSTSGFGLAGDQYAGDARRFLNSIDPDCCIKRIAPRPVWIFHAESDEIIPYASGVSLYGRASDPKEFIAISGGHGINGDVDAWMIARLGANL